MKSIDVYKLSKPDDNSIFNYYLIFDDKFIITFYSYTSFIWYPEPGVINSIRKDPYYTKVND